MSLTLSSPFINLPYFSPFHPTPPPIVLLLHRCRRARTLHILFIASSYCDGLDFHFNLSNETNTGPYYMRGANPTFTWVFSKRGWWKRSRGVRGRRFGVLRTRSLWNVWSWWKPLSDWKVRHCLKFELSAIEDYLYSLWGQKRKSLNKFAMYINSNLIK